MVTRRRTSRKSKEPKEGWQNVSLWESTRGNSAYSGNVQLTLDFLSLLYDAIEEGAVEIQENDDGREYIELGIALRDNDSGKRRSPAFLGNVWISESEEEEEDDEPRRGRSRRRADDEDEEPRRNRRSSRRR